MMALVISFISLSAKSDSIIRITTVVLYRLVVISKFFQSRRLIVSIPFFSFSRRESERIVKYIAGNYIPTFISFRLLRYPIHDAITTFHKVASHTCY